MARTCKLLCCAIACVTHSLRVLFCYSLAQRLSCFVTVRALLAALNILDNFCQGLRQLVPVHQKQVLGWGVMQRGRFMSMSSVVETPFFALARPVINLVGMAGSVRLGLASFIAERVGYIFCQKPWHFLIMALAGSGHPSASGAIQGMLTAVGDRVGLAQGELQSALSLSRQIGMILSPTFWTAVYETGMRYGYPSSMYCGAAIIAGVNLLLSLGLRFSVPTVVADGTTSKQLPAKPNHLP